MANIYEPYQRTVDKFSKEGLIIRSAERSDLEGLINMKRNIIKELVPDLSKWYKNDEILAEEFYGPVDQDSEKRVYYVAEDSKNKNLVGSIGLVQYNPLYNPSIGHLVNNYLTLENRGKGLGNIMLWDIIKKARKMKFSMIHLSTHPEFEDAQALYRKYGFQIVKNVAKRRDKPVEYELVLSRREYTIMKKILESRSYALR